MLPSFLLAGVLILLAALGLIAGDPVGYCGAESSSACTRWLGEFAVPVSVAGLTLVIAYGQYKSGKRQAAAADLQVQIAAVPLVEADIRAYQSLAAFITRLRTEVTSVQQSIQRVRASQSGGSLFPTYDADFPEAISAFDNIRDTAATFFNQMEYVIIPPSASEIQGFIIEIGQGFTSRMVRTILLMKAFLDDNPESGHSVGSLALSELNLHMLATAETTCEETIAKIDQAASEIAVKVAMLHERRTSFMSAII
jgi:hypothetical protein